MHGAVTGRAPLPPVTLQPRGRLPPASASPACGARFRLGLRRCSAAASPRFGRPRFPRFRLGLGARFCLGLRCCSAVPLPRVGHPCRGAAAAPDAACHAARLPPAALPAAACPDACRWRARPNESLPPIKPPPTRARLTGTAPTPPLLLETVPDPAIFDRSSAPRLSPARCLVDADASAGVGSAGEAAVEAQGAVAGRLAAEEAAAAVVDEVVDAAPHRAVCGPLASAGRRPWISTGTTSPCHRHVA